MWVQWEDRKAAKQYGYLTEKGNSTKADRTSPHHTNQAMKYLKEHLPDVHLGKRIESDDIFIQLNRKYIEDFHKVNTR